MKFRTLSLASSPSGPSVSRAQVTRLGASSGLLWQSSKIAVAGVGVAANGPVDQIAALLQSMDSLDPTSPTRAGQPGHVPLALTAMAFSPDAPSSATIPVHTLAISDGQATLTVCGPEAEASDEALLARLAGLLPASGELTDDGGRSGAPPTVSSALSAEVWRDEIVTDGIRRIQQGDLNKVVLARELVAQVPEPIDIAATVERLAFVFPQAIVFNINGFIGASPELLVSRRGEVVMARPLAGTAPRSDDADKDAALADELMRSTKNQSEHRITIDWFLNELLPWCSYVDAEPEPSLLTVANVHHLQTVVEGVLSAPPAPILDLVRTLHPTPAVGGDPQSEALRVISEIEQAERGRYAGPAGWFDADGNGAFAVSVRTAEIADRTATLFAGVGVVADSDPASELAETAIKAKAILESLRW